MTTDAQLKVRLGWMEQMSAPLARGLRKLNDALPADLVAAGGADAATAAIATWVAERHEGGGLLEEIVPLLIERVGVREEQALDYALAAISAFRQGVFAIEDWWDAAGMHELAIVNLTIRARAAAGPDQARGLLADRFALTDEATDAVWAMTEPLAHIDEQIARAAGDDETVARFVETVTTTGVDRSPGLSDHSALHPVERAITLHKAARAMLVDGDNAAELTGERANTQPLERFARAVRDAIEAHTKQLTIAELRLLVSGKDADDPLRLITDEIRSRLLMVAISSRDVVVNGVSDRLDSRVLAADWLEDAIFSGGGRSGTFAFGPIAYLWVALEEAELEAGGRFPQLALGLVENAEAPVCLTVIVGVLPDDPQIHFDLGGHLDTLRWLGLLVATRRVMVDAFVIGANRRLELRDRFVLKPTRLIEDIRETTVALLRERGPGSFLEFDEGTGDARIGFQLSDNAKSELLLDLARHQSGDAARARAELLNAEAERADALYRGDDVNAFTARAVEARRKFAAARLNARSAPAATPGVAAAHTELVGGLATDTRALVHYNIQDEYLVGFWTASGGEASGVLEPVVALSAVQKAVEPWYGEGYSSVDVETLLATCRPLADQLDEVFADTGVSELVLMPSGIVQAVPFGALATSGGYLDDRYRISYAPSAAILRHLAERPRVETSGVKLVAAHGGTLRWADAEVAAAAMLYPGAHVLADGASKADVLRALSGGRIAQVATHGQWWREDHFASRLDLHLDDRRDRYISLAELHRDIGQTASELVLLSACDTGRSPALDRAVELYSGIDGAFLIQGAAAVVSTLWRINDLSAFLFMTNLHVRLLAGDSVAEAFDNSVRLLREGTAGDLPAEDPLAVALDLGSPEWRAASVRGAAQLRQPRVWAPFRLSGAHWLSRPLADG